MRRTNWGKTEHIRTRRLLEMPGASPTNASLRENVLPQSLPIIAQVMWYSFSPVSTGE